MKELCEWTYSNRVCDFWFDHPERIVLAVLAFIVLAIIFYLICD
jgi:hypothetical protein